MSQAGYGTTNRLLEIATNPELLNLMEHSGKTFAPHVCKGTFSAGDEIKGDCQIQGFEGQLELLVFATLSERSLDSQTFKQSLPMTHGYLITFHHENSSTVTFLKSSLDGTSVKKLSTTHTRYNAQGSIEQYGQTTLENAKILAVYENAYGPNGSTTSVILMPEIVTLKVASAEVKYNYITKKL